MVILRSLTTAWLTMRRNARSQLTQFSTSAPSARYLRRRCSRKLLSRASSASMIRLPNMSPSYNAVVTFAALPLPRDLLGRAVQGYGPMGKPVGKPGEEGGTFDWPGSGQIYSSSRDMDTFLAANLGEVPGHGPIENAMAFTYQGVFTVSPRLTIGLAWQIVSAGNFTIIDKNGGLNNTSTYIGFAPAEKTGRYCSRQSWQAACHRDRAANHSRAGTRPVTAF